MSLQHALKEWAVVCQALAEGVSTTRSVYEQSRQLDISMPITEEVYRVLYEGKDPRAAVTDLMLRSPKGEQ